ncbi:helix-turn-helix domain-containing protein [Aphanizomenon flos-aquae NRERC-008]|jgi:ribosome-binding protein aMBF1 (putative translation factor)|uniref:Helix-turn-helix domain-containing protein n=1 Tax=Aphanizomenon flos-aquae FACHB-1249 TaxID=2692889 RepID=A0ABR8IU52_APHFL|nr:MULTISPECIES: helix-turn-helix domain-containing protein [Nostocales]MBD1216639.1 helix-turn-helix domain-containing protein [Aphanizomenon flos-aquae Clear-A1]MBD2390224.1 helix-turn-helix domain-containing protein [Aphanizomenon flos-aquae FACHB-1171]MBD2555809.1 helix-turn-helix domain-containing protein [Aphanizomenon flos-aquae FACHB-1290]MBD2632139.1 helix-turn-helix domain-containing protein [Aphanizomenon sp. FACHB-1399]MBD2642933.1 helix-turn-helix domain-containing protein [Aphani
MILNERQYMITKAQIKKFQLAVENLEKKVPPQDNENEKLRHQSYLGSLNGEIEELLEQVEEYENLKSRKIDRLECKSLEELPEALIKARIFRGLTQGQLAELLNVKEQQVQRDEANEYANSSFTKILKVQRALDIEIREEVIFK